MRIHHLEITAFGPFAGTESVDFDALTDAGLFLLCGPTGAGKTSVLDAICFGLYGEVPGDRNSAKRLRSDHAGPGVAPAVTLELSVNGRRFRLRRSPAWSRPKRRGTGFTTEQARVLLEESVDGSWVHLSSRLDETGHLVTDLLGMNPSQFTQVAMLPQGRFQAFLRAKSDERHKVLQRLFRTSRFEDIERWLVARRQTLRASSKEHQDAVASVVSRLSESAGTDLPEDWELHDLALPAEAGDVAGWARDLVAEAASAREALSTEATAAGRLTDDARRRLDEGRGTMRLRSRHEEAVGIARSLEESQEQEDRARAALDAARRASVVVPLARHAQETATAVERAQRALGQALADAARLLDTDAAALTQGDLEVAERDATEAATIARTLLPREAELQRAERDAARVTRTLSRLAEERTGLDQRCTTIPGQVAELRTRLTEQVTLAAEAETLVAAEQAATERLDAARRVTSLRADLEDAGERLRASTDVAQRLRQRYQDLREARISGMAAELAASLAVGESCPVCGSADHPQVALSVDGAPTRSDEEHARTEYENAEFDQQTRREVVATLRQNLAVADHASGGQSVAGLRDELAALRERRAASAAAASERDRLATSVADLEAELADAIARLQQLAADEARLRAERDHAQAVVESVSAELSALFAEDEVAGSVSRLIEARTAAGAAFGMAREALAARDRATTQAQEAGQRAQECALEHGFADTATATRAVLTAADHARLEQLLRERDALRAQSRATLADAEVTAAVAADTPDLAALAEAAQAAEAALTDVAARAREAQKRAERLVALERELARELAAWAPTRAAYAVASGLSTFAEGKGGDNALQMRLSAYVLSSRLQQVVAAANERLHGMSDERYTLEHSSARGVGEVRGGLSLLVRDEWTGESRDPATLSGGETFVTSLALALGLADVVTQEAGGSSIDTLFIDEGFGTLDPETLDDVMDTLDTLRDGGRVVGVVSHVPEMRTRIPAQLQIRKDRSGSRVVAAREAV